MKIRIMVVKRLCNEDCRQLRHMFISINSRRNCLETNYTSDVYLLKLGLSETLFHSPTIFSIVKRLMRVFFDHQNSKTLYFSKQ